MLPSTAARLKVRKQVREMKYSREMKKLLYTRSMSAQYRVQLQPARNNRPTPYGSARQQNWAGEELNIGTSAHLIALLGTPRELW